MNSLIASAVFRCEECGYTFKLKHPDDDPTSSSGCCKLCGGRQWRIYFKYPDGHIEKT